MRQVAKCKIRLSSNANSLFALTWAELLIAPIKVGEL